jgi:hypothetical protein
MDSLKTIINLVFFVDIEDNSRKRRLVDARRAYSKILKDVGFSYQHIGHSLGKDHATIIHYVKSIDDLLKYDSVFQKKFMLAKKNFLKENKHLIPNSKEDIYTVSIVLENRLSEILSKKEEIICSLDNYEKENGTNECIDYCKKLMLSLFDS